MAKNDEKESEEESKTGKGSKGKDSSKAKSKTSISHAELERLKKVAKAEEKENEKVRSFLDTAMARLKKAIDRDDHNRKASLNDLRFSNGEDQWPDKIKTQRTTDGRPCLQFDLLTENIMQVVGDQRHNKVKCKVRPVDNDSDPEIARIRQGIISGVEYLSNAERIYDYSMEMICRGAYAAWEIKVRYTEENPFLQEMYMQRIENPHTVYLGPGHDECHADAKWGFKLDKMAIDDFKDMHPGKELPGDNLKTGSAMGYEHWWAGELVTVADYYIIKNKKVTMALLSDGRVMEEENAKAEVKDAADIEKAAKLIGPLTTGMGPGAMPPMGMPAGGPMAVPPQGPNQINPMGQMNQMMGGGALPIEGTSPLSVEATSRDIKPATGSPALPEEEGKEVLHIAKTRETLIPKVKHYTISAMEILSENGLEGEDFPGSFVPLILVQGPEINIEGKSHVRSFIRSAKDPQKNYNFWVSAAAETVALAPKAEWIGTAKQFAGYENDYASSNLKNFPMLKYNVDDEFLPGYAPPPPQRVAVKDPPIGIFTEMLNAKTAVKDSLGMHARDVGDTGPERSGAAIGAAQRPSDIGSFPFFDNLKRAIEHSNRVMNSMIPEIYDSERDVRIRDETDNITSVPVNTTVGDALKRVREDPDKYRGMDVEQIRGAQRKFGKNARFNDLTVGKYNVISTTGPAYATQRAESSEQMLRLATVDKRIMGVAGDLVIRSMDFLHSDEVADRLEKTLPPGMVPPKEGKKPMPPMSPPPQAQLLMQKAKTETLKQQREVEKTKVETLKLKVEMVKLMKETKETDGEVRKQIIKVIEELTNPAPIPGEEGWGVGKKDSRSINE